MSRSRLALAVPVLALLASSPAAQVPEAAQKELKAAAKALLADLQPDLNGLKATALAAAAAFDKGIADEGYTIGHGITLQTALLAFQSGVSAELAQVATGLRDAAAAALAAHGPWGGVLPAGFSPGDGGTWDDTRAAALKKAGAAIGSVLKRLEASSKKLQAKEGFPLFVLLRTPQMEFLSASDAGAGGLIKPCRIDVVVSVGGFIAMGGDATWGYGVDLTVATVLGGFKFSVSDLEPDVSNRFEDYFWDDETGTWFEPGIYDLLVSQGFAGSDGVQIGAR